MSLEEIITTYGYAAVGIGSFLEGESVLVLGGFAAQRDYLELPWVIVCAFLGALFGDQLYYFIGRIKGKSVLEKRPKWKARSEKVFYLLQKHQILLILGFRFIYGLRIVTPILIGASSVSPTRFIILNILGAAIWAVIIGSLGYLFGYTLVMFIDNVKKYELLIFISIAVAGAIIWLLHFRKRH